jgi:cob(I)alamin adenosyltransferase
VKIYTKRGDEGFTDLFGGARVLKNHAQVRAYGEIDMANSAIGFALSAAVDSDLRDNLLWAMRLLFSAGSEVATAQKSSAEAILEKHLDEPIQDQHSEMLESMIDAAEGELVPLKTFILPTGSDLSARLHLARCAVRRVEVALLDFRAEGLKLRPEILKFFNRLSDALFVFARLANHRQSSPEIYWQGSPS